MLDFYWVRDDERFTPKLTSERMLGGLTFEEYTALDHLWAVLRRNGIRVEFMEDGRLSAGEVVDALRITNKLTANDAAGDAAYQNLRMILRAAKQNNAGIASLAD